MVSRVPPLQVRAPDPPIVDNQVTVSITTSTITTAILSSSRSKTSPQTLSLTSTPPGWASIPLMWASCCSMAKVFDDTSRWTGHRQKPRGYPAPLRAGEHQHVLETGSQFPIYQLRAISTSGRIANRLIMPVRPTGNSFHTACFLRPNGRR